MDLKQSDAKFYSDPIILLTLGVLTIVEVGFDAGVFYLFWNKILPIGFKELPHFDYLYILCFGMLAIGWRYVKFLLKDVLQMYNLLLHQARGEEDNE